MLPPELLSRLRATLATELLRADVGETLLAVTPVARSAAVRGVADAVGVAGGERAADAAHATRVAQSALALSPAPSARPPLAPAPQRLSSEASNGRTAVAGAAQAVLERPPPAHAATAEVASVESHLSAAGRLLAGLAGSGYGARAAAVEGSAEPLVAKGPDAIRLASALRDVLTASGLFYESHLAEWVVGERPRQQLAREPQTHFAPVPQAASDQLERPAPNAVEVLGPVAERIALGEPPAARDDGLPLSSAARELVGQQLNLLEAGHVVWQGTAWPGQTIEWEVREGSTQGEVSSPLDNWTTRLRLELPHLGEVAAHLTWRHGRLALRIAADSPHHAGLVAALPALREALHIAGVTVGPLAVDTHDA